MNTLTFIYRNLDSFRSRFWVVFGAGVLDGFALFLIPVLLAEFTKGAFTSQYFLKLIIFIAILYSASLFLQRIMRKYGEALGTQFGNYIRLKYFKQLEALPFERLVSHHSGYILSLVNKVSDGMAPILFDVFWTFAKGVSNISLFFFFTARESMAIAVLNTVVLVIFVAVSTFLSRKMVPIAEELNVKRASLLESYADFMSNILTVKKLGVFGFAEQKLLGKTGENFKQIQKLQTFHANRWFLLHSLFGTAFLATIGFLLYEISVQQASASLLILFIGAYAIVRQNVERFSETFKALMEMKAYARTLDGIVATHKEAEKGEQVSAWQEIVFEDVVFQYQNSARSIRIQEFHIRKGEKICITGKSGEGKTTFLNLFARFLDSKSGERSVDDLSYEAISRDFFEQHIAVVAQDVELFNMSLRENIALGKHVEDEEIWDILRELDLLSWAEHLEDGLETIVGEKGVKLSAGQKQRINIARGIMLGREIYLLDEPTAHLDAATEQKVIQFLEKHLAGKTAIIISHYEAIRKLCGRSYIVQNHTLTEV